MLNVPELVAAVVGAAVLLMLPVEAVRKKPVVGTEIFAVAVVMAEVVVQAPPPSLGAAATATVRTTWWWRWRQCCCRVLQ